MMSTTMAVSIQKKEHQDAGSGARDTSSIRGCVGCRAKPTLVAGSPHQDDIRNIFFSRVRLGIPESRNKTLTELILPRKKNTGWEICQFFSEWITLAKFRRILTWRVNFLPGKHVFILENHDFLPAMILGERVGGWTNSFSKKDMQKSTLESTFQPNFWAGKHSSKRKSLVQLNRPTNLCPYQL